MAGERIAVVGSRDFCCPELVWAVVGTFDPRDILVSGGARGVDSEAEHAADARGLKKDIKRAKWRRADGSFDEQAGFSRNTDIVRACDRVVAFWNGHSSGTADTIQKARKAKKPVLIINAVRT